VSKAVPFTLSAEREPGDLGESRRHSTGSRSLIRIPVCVPRCIASFPCRAAKPSLRQRRERAWRPVASRHVPLAFISRGGSHGMWRPPTPQLLAASSADSLDAVTVASGDVFASSCFSEDLVRRDSGASDSATPRIERCRAMT